jgi:zinc D-Ala-D-Ala dipeptidase
VSLRAVSFGIAALLTLGSACAAQTKPPNMVALRNVDPSIRQDMRYAGPDNFTGRPLPGYRKGECYMQRAAALALKRVQADLAAQGLSLKVYDCYRPARAVAGMARLAGDMHATPDTRRFYPGLNKAHLFALGYIASHSAHSRGVAIDLTVVPRNPEAVPTFDPKAQYGSCAGPIAAREPDDSLDMGTGFDCFSAKSRTHASDLTPEQRSNRDCLLQAMTRYGFHNYFLEWWHFTFPAVDPRQEYDFEVRSLD